MWTLGIDTSAGRTATALGGEGGWFERCCEDGTREHSRRLMELIAELLGEARLGFADLGAIGVAAGPGSFTGLRIGIATANGLGFGLGKPVVGVSSLEALAWCLRERPGGVVPVLDARHGQVFAARYLADGRGVEEVEAPRAAEPRQGLRGLIRAGDRVIGEGLIRYGPVVEELVPGAVLVPGEAPTARAVVEIACSRLSGGGGVPRAATPIYLRRPHVRAARP